MKNINRLLVVAIVAVLVFPGFIVAGIAQACCGVNVNYLTADDAPDPLCEGASVTISGTYNVFTEWGSWTELYDTGWGLRIFDESIVEVFSNEWTLATNQPDPGADPGTEWSFSYDWSVPAAGDYTYEVYAWSLTGYGRMDTSVMSGSFTALAGQCADCLVEQEIRNRWDAECPACDEAGNHGAYVGCRADIQNEYLEAGLITPEESSCLMNPEARSDCGKKNP